MKLPLVTVLSVLLLFPGRGAVPRGKLTSGTVTLFALSKHRDYEKATFSFEHGIRDDPGLLRTHNDWDLEYGGWGDTFNVYTVTNDRSVIADLGAKGFDDITGLPKFPPFQEHLTTRVAAFEGHAYAVHPATTIPTRSVSSASRSSPPRTSARSSGSTGSSRRTSVRNWSSPRPRARISRGRSTGACKSRKASRCASRSTSSSA